MASHTLFSGSSEGNGAQFGFVVDWDDVALTIGLACTGTGHAEMTVIRTSNRQRLGQVFADQFGATAGPIAQAGSVDLAGSPNAGESSSAVSYDGSRHIVVGPGASGIQSDGSALPTTNVTAAIVGRIQPPKGTQPGLDVELNWNP